MDSSKPYQSNNPYARKMKKRSQLPNDDTATEEDSAETASTETNGEKVKADLRPKTSLKPKPSLSTSTFSSTDKEALKRRLARKDQY